MEPKLVALFLEAQAGMFFHLVNPILILILQREPHGDEAKNLQLYEHQLALLIWHLLLFYDLSEDRQNYLRLVL